MNAPFARRLLALAGGVLLADGLVLMARGHFDLGTMLPAGLGAAFLAMVVYWVPLADWRSADRRLQRLWHLGWWGMAAWLVSLGVFCALQWDIGVAPAAVPPVQAIVVLGGGIRGGEPRPGLAARLDRAAELARLQPGALVAVCGGAVWGEEDTEADAMARYLRQRHGIAPERLVLERESTSTVLNLQLARPLLAARGVPATAPLALVTSDFHLWRALRIAARQGFSTVVPVAAATPRATRLNAWLREYFATFSSWVLREG